MNRFGIIAITACIICSCSIIEDRSQCPHYIRLDFSKVDTDRWESLEVSISGPDGFIFTDTVTEKEYGDYIVEIPGDEVCINVFGPYWIDYVDGKGLDIDVGEDCPEYFLHASRLYHLSDYQTDTVILHKNRCLVTMTMTTDGSPVVFDLEVNGNVCGYDTCGQPVDGTFRVQLKPGKQGYCSFGLPRQKDNSLNLKVLEGGETLREFALGEYIAASGYDWTAPDLEDIQLEIDFTRTLVHFIIDEWEQTFSFEVEI